MGSSNAKDQRHKHKDENNSDQMKDEYVKFIRREQLRREKEFKDRSHDKEMIYTKIKQTYQKSESSVSNEENHGCSLKKQKSKFKSAIKILKNPFKEKKESGSSTCTSKAQRISSTLIHDFESSMNNSNIQSNLFQNSSITSQPMTSRNEKTSTLSQMINITDDSLCLTLNNHPKSLKIERVPDDQSVLQQNLKNHDITHKKDMEWVAVLNQDLRQNNDKEFSEKLATFLQQYIEKGKSKLDPKEFRTLYIKKICQDQTNSKKHGRHVSMNANCKKKFTIINVGSQIEANPFDQAEELTMTNDIIGLSFYDLSDQYKRKFLTLYSHLLFEHHPIRKLMDEFRNWLDEFIKEKNIMIKQGANFFQKEDVQGYMGQQTQKLLEVIIDYVNEFVKMMSKSMVLFYQLDVVSGEITEVCLYNLLTSLILKNPIYTRVIDLFRTAYRDEMQKIELQIEQIQDRKNELSQLLGIKEEEIGRHILQYNNSKRELVPGDVIEEEESSQCSGVYSQKDRERCREAFHKTLKKILYVKNHSSPTAKIEYISKLFMEIIPGTGQQAADFVLNLLIFSLICLGKRSADLYIEQQYIQSFCHEEMIDKIEQYQDISQLHMALTTLTMGIEEHVSNLQQGIQSRSVSAYSQSYEGTSSRKRSSQSAESTPRNEINNNSKEKQRDQRVRKGTFNETGINKQNQQFPTYEQRTSSTNQRTMDSQENMLCLSPDNLPKANIVEDQDYDLNQERFILANIRQERVQSWARVVKYDHINSQPLQSLAQGAAQVEDNGILQAIQEDFELTMQEMQTKQNNEKMILTTTGSIFNKLVDRKIVNDEEMDQFQPIDSDFFTSLINQKRRLKEEIKEEDEY